MIAPMCGNPLAAGLSRPAEGKMSEQYAVFSLVLVAFLGGLLIWIGTRLEEILEKIPVEIELLEKILVEIKLLREENKEERDRRRYGA
jgi:hypothetical protein